MRDHRPRKGDGGSLFPRSRRVWSAILVGLAVGLIASLLTFSTREYRQIGMLERRSSNFATKFAEQVKLASLSASCKQLRLGWEALPVLHYRRNYWLRRSGEEEAEKSWQMNKG